MSRARLVWVGLGIVGDGAVMGALAGIVVTTSVVVALAIGPNPLLLLGDPFVYEMGALFGGGCGVVLAPLATFGYLRHVPLWRVFVEGALGTMVTGIVAALTLTHLWAILAVGALGFLLATARLAAVTPETLPPPGRSPAA